MGFLGRFPLTLALSHGERGFKVAGLGWVDVCLGEVLAFVEEGFSGYLGEGVS